MSIPRFKRFVIDRRESDRLCFEDEAGFSSDVLEIDLPRDCRAEGAVLEVPISPSGEPLWSQAIRNRIEEAIRKEEGKKRLGRLRSLDPGGDVQL